MTQRNLNRAVAHATGESVDMIERMGFGPLTEAVVETDPRMLDWDEDDDSRLAMQSVRRRRLSTVPKVELRDRHRSVNPKSVE